MKPLGRAIPFALVAVAVVSQTGPSYFELKLPDLNKVIGSGNVVADVPPDHLSRLTIQLLGSADKNLGYGDVHVRINGKGAGNIFNSGANDRGKFLSMDPSTLAARHDVIFDPRENTVEVYGTDRRSRTYYQNWILRSGLENINPFFTYVSELSPVDESGLPPDLNLDQPTGPIPFPNTTGRSLTVRLKGSAGASSGIATLTANGKPLQSVGPGLVWTFNELVPVPRSDEVLVIQAVDKKGNKRSITIPISHPTMASQRFRSSGERFALLIGISRFAKADTLPAITAAAADTRLLAHSLKERGFRDQNVRMLTDEQATSEQVRTALEDFTARAKPEDLLVIFVSTHGVHNPSSPEHIYLAAADTQPRALNNTAIEISELQLLLNRALRCRHTLLFFDAEHTLGPEWSFSGKSVVHSHLLTLLSETVGSSVLVSSSSGQDSHDQRDATEARGLFAAALADGLVGSADVNHDGVLTARELCAFVSETVRNATGNKQVPEFRFSETEADAPLMSLAQ
jgi:hypothetical protein